LRYSVILLILVITNIALAQDPNFPFICQPVGGTSFGNLHIVNYFDHDPDVNILVWDCTQYSIDGHIGTDIAILSFEEQFIGVPIFAVMDGLVSTTHDGEDDMNTSLEGQPDNHVFMRN